MRKMLLALVLLALPVLGSIPPAQAVRCGEFPVVGDPCLAVCHAIYPVRCPFGP